MSVQHDIPIITQFRTKSQIFFQCLVLSTRAVFHPKPKGLGFHTATLGKVKGSGNWYRAARALARHHRKVARQRLDWQWKLADELCTEFDTLCFETLNLDGMKRLWGRKVSDHAFYQFLQILKQKCAKHGKKFVKIGRWTPTTKPCSDCGYHNKDLSLSDRHWTCPECGSDHDRDVNAAMNIKQAGLAA